MFSILWVRRAFNTGKSDASMCTWISLQGGQLSSQPDVKSHNWSHFMYVKLGCSGVRHRTMCHDKAVFLLFFPPPKFLHPEPFKGCFPLFSFIVMVWEEPSRTYFRIPRAEKLEKQWKLCKWKTDFQCIDVFYSGVQFVLCIGRTTRLLHADKPQRQCDHSYELKPEQ